MMIMALNCGDAFWTVLSRVRSAGSDHGRRFLVRRVAAAADDGLDPAFAEGQGECLTKLVVLLLELLEPVCCALEALKQRGLRGALLVGN